MTHSTAAPEPMVRAAVAGVAGSAEPTGATNDISVADLLRKLESLPVIEQSKGVLSGHYGISTDQAFALLRRWSSHHNLKVRDLSQLIVSAAAEGPSHRTALRRLLERLGG